MKTVVLVIAVIKKRDAVLLRKKPDGSPPYKETWYLFGGEITPENNDSEKAITNTIRKQASIEIRPVQRLSWDTEIKADSGGELIFYVYLDYLCEYMSGELMPSEGIEKLEWVPIDKLPEYDLVPPSVKLFRKLGYIK